MTKAERLAKVHDRAMRRFDAIWSVVKEERELALRDRRCAAVRGAMWEGQFAVGEDADEQDAIDTAAAGSPRLEVPRHLKPIRRLQGEFRAARKTVDFKPKGDASRADADNLDGLYRADANDSPAGPTAATDNAFNEASVGGIGGWRLRARYEDEMDEANEHQRIAFEPIYDADQSMFFDIDAKHQGKLDATHAFLLFGLTRAAFEERYPDHSTATFTDTLTWNYDWVRPDTLTLAEYFEVEDRSVLRRTFRQTSIAEVLPEGKEPEERTYDDADLREEREDGSTLEEDLRAKGWEQVRQRRIKRQRVRKYLITGAEVLEDEGYIAGQYIPIVPFFFEYRVVGGIERTQGMLRPALDSARLLNLSVSNVAEVLAAPADETPILAPEQVDNAILADWAARKVKRPAALLLKPIYGPDGQSIIQAGLSGVLAAPQVSQAASGLLTFAAQSVDELMGATDQPETVPSNTSAAAIQLVNDAGDVNDYLWHDNYALALEVSGRIWLSMASELYVEPGREMVSIDGEGVQSPIKLADPQTDEEGTYRANDLTSGRYDVVIDVGPATKTRQDATVRNMLAIGQSFAGSNNTDAANACYGIAVLNMEGEGTEGIRQWVRKQGVQGGWVEPNDEEKKALEEAAQNASPDPNTLIAQAQVMVAQAEQTKAETGRLEAQARLITAQAQAEKARADAARALAGIDQADREQILREVKAETDSDRADDRLALDAAVAGSKQTAEAMNG